MKDMSETKTYEEWTESLWAEDVELPWEGARQGTREYDLYHLAADYVDNALLRDSFSWAGQHTYAELVAQATDYALSEID